MPSSWVPPLDSLPLQLKFCCINTNFRRCMPLRPILPLTRKLPLGCFLPHYRRILPQKRFNRSASWKWRPTAFLIGATLYRSFCRYQTLSGIANKSSIIGLPGTGKRCAPFAGRRATQCVTTILTSPCKTSLRTGRLSYHSASKICL